MLEQEQLNLPCTAVFEESDATTPACERFADSAPSCAQHLYLKPCLERFRREAVWRVLDTGRYRCPYMLWGQGPALVFIPGLCDDPWSFVLPMARLSERFCCLAYAMPTGVGDGARLAGYRHDDLVADLFALLDHLGIREAIAVGDSFGSTVALRALHDQPERFARGILLGGFARRPLAWAERMLAAFARWWPGRLDDLPGRTPVVERLQFPGFAERESEVWDYFLHHDGQQPIAAVAYRARILQDIDLRPILPRIRQPVLLVCGDRDPLVGKECERELLQGLPRAARAEIEGCGHMPQYTHPEILCEVIERWAAS
jgi:pimeloyl-ACP methyl ester carboxylesterase